MTDEDLDSLQETLQKVVVEESSRKQSMASILGIGDHAKGHPIRSKSHETDDVLELLKLMIIVIFILFCLGVLELLYLSLL